MLYQVQAWRELDIDLEVGFNLSPRQFWQPDLARRIVHEVRNADVDAGRVTVEITESSAMMDPDRSQRILWELHDAGLSIAIDDFGTGYSSFSRLLEMPVRVLKIDRSFVQNVHEHSQRGAIVTAFLELAQGLGMTSLAEGIETPEELAFLRQRGCRLGQGFYFSRARAARGDHRVRAGRHPDGHGARLGLISPAPTVAPPPRSMPRRCPPTRGAPRGFPIRACRARRA